MLRKVSRQGLHVGLRRLQRNEAQRHQFTGGIIDEDDQGAAWTAPLQPVMGRAVDLYQLPTAGPTRPTLMDAGLTAPFGLPEPLGDHPLAQGLDTDRVAMPFGQLLAGERGAEVGIVAPDNPEDLLPDGIRDGVPRTFPPMARNQSSRPFDPVAGHQAFDLTHTHPQLPGRIPLPKLLACHLLDHPQPVHLLMTHRHDPLRHRPS